MSDQQASLDVAVLDGHPRPEGTVAGLRVDQSDPFFFDHPLDHVPGMLLVCAMLALVRDAGNADVGRNGPGWLQFSFGFRAFCESARPVELRTSAAGGRRHAVHASQDGATVCEGWVELLDGAAPSSSAGTQAHRPVMAAQPALVHRDRPENVMIGQPRRSGRHLLAPILAPPPGHFLNRCDGGCHSAEKLIEAGRQLTILLPLFAAGHPVTSQFIWTDVCGKLPYRVPLDVPLALRCSGDQPQTSRYRLRFGIVDGSAAAGASTQTDFGELVSACRVVKPAVFRAFRKAQRAR